MKEGKKEKIKPSKRAKKRYIKFALSGGENISMEEVHSALWNTVMKLYGRTEAGKLRIKLMEFKNGKGIVRCCHKHTEEVKAGLLSLEEAAGTKVAPRTIKTSGTLKKLRGHASRK